MPASAYEKVIGWWKKGYQLESTPTDTPGVWTDVPADTEPEWNFDDLTYRIKVNPASCSGYFNIYTTVSGDENGATSHRISGPFASDSAANAEAAASSVPRTARLLRNWDNGALESD